MFNISFLLKLMVVLIVVALAGGPTLPAAAQTEPFEITVNSTDDLDDLNRGDGVCTASIMFTKCTLRAAVSEAVAYNGGSDLVYIHLPAGIYKVLIPGADENINATGDFDIINPHKDILIEGADTLNPPVIDGNHLDRVFGIAGNQSVVLRYLVIRNGQINNSNDYNRMGGGIINSANLELNTVLIENNTVTCSPQSGSCAGAVGGGVYNSGTLKIFNTTIRGNYAYRGGGIFNGGGSPGTEIVNSTIFDNGASSVGAINSFAPLTMLNTTISGNTAANATGGVFMDGALLMMANVTLAWNTTSSGIASNLVVNVSPIIRNSIIAYPDAGKPNCSLLSGTVTPQGVNLSSDASCGLNSGVDKINRDPKLTSLMDWGGPTWTHGLLNGSPAINAGDPLGCKDFNNYLLTNDQRGVFRTLAGCDIGAFEGVIYAIFQPLIMR